MATSRAGVRGGRRESDRAAGACVASTARPRVALLAAFGASVVIRATTPTALGQWSVTTLTPPGIGYTQVRGVAGPQQVGVAEIGIRDHACLWFGQSGSMVDLMPAGSVHSIAYATDGVEQAGYATIGTMPHAGLWRGTASSWTDLHPPGALLSRAFGLSQGTQVGYVETATTSHAALWRGTAGSHVDLHPGLPALSSLALAASGDAQVGWAQVTDATVRAALWRGTAASFVSLHPSDATRSEALGLWTDGVGGGVQVGYARVEGADRAAIWGGSAASWRYLNPTGATRSFATGTLRELQCGYALFDGRWRAGLWRGTSELWEDLSPALPGTTWSDSYAMSLWTDGVTLRVAGRALSTFTQRDVAVVWSRPCRPTFAQGPRSASVCRERGARFTAEVAPGTGVPQIVWQWTHPERRPGWAEVMPGANVMADGSHAFEAGSHPAGAMGSTLDLWLLSGEASGVMVRCVASSGCAQAAGEPATLTLRSADVNGDGVIESGDLARVIDVIGGGPNPEGIEPDVNEDGNVDQDDAAAWLRWIAGGPCP